MLIWFCFFLSFETWKHFCFNKFFLKLCAIWVHVSLRVVNRFIICILNVPIVVEELVGITFKSWKGNGNKKTH